jgi:protein involved in polysaccharide export with SLBB domain
MVIHSLLHARHPHAGALRLHTAAAAARPGLLAHLLVLGLLWVSGTAFSQPASPAAMVTPPQVEYRISRGDDLDLKFFFTPELNTRAAVRSDGRISVPLLGELMVEGRTVAELGALIEKGLAGQVNRPQVAINVQTTSSMRVFVGGEVGKPGVQPLSGPMTALQAVMVAEGLKDTAQPSMALVLRRSSDGGRQVIPLDLDAAMKGLPPHADLVLQPFDAVVVPRSGIADVARWVDLYIRRTLPLNFGVSYNVNGRTATP